MVGLAAAMKDGRASCHEAGVGVVDMCRHVREHVHENVHENVHRHVHAGHVHGQVHAHVY